MKGLRFLRFLRFLVLWARASAEKRRRETLTSYFSALLHERVAFSAFSAFSADLGRPQRLQEHKGNLHQQLFCIFA